MLHHRSNTEIRITFMKDHARARLVAWTLALTRTSRLAPRPWRIEEALLRGLGDASWASQEIEDWLRCGAVGVSADGLSSILALLNRQGALVYSAEWRALLIDPWWREQVLAELRTLLEPESLETLSRVAAELDDLEGRTVLASCGC